MKSEHRHELKTNSLDRVVSQVGTFFKKNGQSIGIGLIGLFVVLIIVTVFVRTKSSRADKAWQAMVSASDAETYETIAEEKANQGAPVAYWARLLSGERHYSEGIGQYFTDRSTGEEELKLAQEAFEAVLQEKGSHDVIRERALFGLARCKETTSDGDLQPAVDAYNTLLAEYPGSIYKDDAEKRIEILKSKDAETFYAWFSKQTTEKPKDLQRPLDGVRPGGAASQAFDPFNELKPDEGGDKNEETSSTKSDDAKEEPDAKNESKTSEKKDAPKAPTKQPK